MRHTSQLEEPDAAWNVPAAHMLHEVALAAEYWPAEQGEQPLEPEADSYLPAAHAAQALEPAAAKFPPVQSVGSAAAAAQAAPPGHDVCAVLATHRKPQ